MMNVLMMNLSVVTGTKLLRPDLVYLKKVFNFVRHLYALQHLCFGKI
jgi:hypothetical protein